MPNEPLSEAPIPHGFDGLRKDFAHYCRVHRAATLGDRLLLPLRAPALFALAVYRFGRWVHFGSRLPRPLLLPLRILYVVLFEVSRHLTGILLHTWAELEENVWLGSFAPILIGARRIGSGSMIHGGVTLGAGGARGARGVPTLGRNVMVGPGASIVGPVRVPDGTVVGPNTLLISTPAVAGAWLGSPAMRWKRAPALLVPADPAPIEGVQA